MRDPYKQGLINKIEAVQKRPTWLITACNHLPYKDRSQNSPSLVHRRRRADMIVLYNMTHGFEPGVARPGIMFCPD